MRAGRAQDAGASPLSDAGADVASTLSAESSACTARSGPSEPLGSAIAVSKPALAAWATVVRLTGEAPASTRQETKAVAPFQLA